MDSLFTKPRLDEKSKLNQRIFRLHNIIIRSIHYNTPHIICGSDGIFPFHHKEKKKILKEVK